MRADGRMMIVDITIVINYILSVITVIGSAAVAICMDIWSLTKIIR